MTKCTKTKGIMGAGFLCMAYGIVVLAVPEYAHLQLTESLHRQDNQTFQDCLHKGLTNTEMLLIDPVVIEPPSVFDYLTGKRQVQYTWTHNDAPCFTMHFDIDMNKVTNRFYGSIFIDKIEISELMAAHKWERQNSPQLNDPMEE